MTKILRLSSSAFNHNGLIPERYTCDGNNFSPPLQISGVPTGAKSLTLIMDDPDAPAGLPDGQAGVWDHWVVYNLPPQTAELKEGEPPAGQLGLGTAGNANYEGPCPPDGVHRYFFKLYVLDIELPLPPGATKTEVLAAMRGHILDQTELIGRYGRLKT
ncbi:MAG: YbhB/YbcL family Raf kinase inhibitor-like protein [Candidatus Vogelbacteria bacterium]|nr:YbhB/YbcL family Raf kinase inhibitor-like protein [Candidatus Vogelbacteria bacterium]